MLFLLATIFAAITSSLTILDRIRTGQEFTILYEAIKIADLEELLSRPGPLTLFAPINSAFQSLGIDLNTIKPEKLRDVLLYHVLGRNMSLPGDIQIGFPVYAPYLGAKEFVPFAGSVSAGLSFETLNGKRVRITGKEHVTAPMVYLPSTIVESYRVHDEASNSLRLTRTYVEDNGVIFRIEHVMNPDRTYNIIDTKGQTFGKGRNFGPINNGFGPPQGYGAKNNYQGSTNIGVSKGQQMTPPKGAINEFRNMNAQRFNEFRSNYGGYRGSDYSKTQS